MSGTEVRFCFLLGDSQGQSFMRSDVSFVFLPIKALVGDFQRAVKVENSNKLSFVDASDLLVYTDKAAYQAGADHLKPLSRLAKAYQGGINDELTDANLDEKQVLYVLVPSLARKLH